MESILNSVKELMGISADYTVFDSEIIMGVNGAFATLQQLGVGPAAGFVITDATTTWDDFMEFGTLQQMCKQYIQKKTRLSFDPPSNTNVADIINRNIAELEWRITNHVNIIGGHQ